MGTAEQQPGKRKGDCKMPVAVSYPGVYIEEIPSGVRTITGVATSITAFIGRAKRGPENNEAKVINSYADYERIYGGLDLLSSMSFAVKDFYLNGGGQAVIVRIFGEEDTDDNADTQSAGRTIIEVDGLTLEAANPGKWGNEIRIAIGLATSEEVAQSIGLEKTDLFSLIIKYAGSSENYTNLTVEGNSERRIDKVLEAQSSLLRWQGKWPETLPKMTKLKAGYTAEEKLVEAETEEEIIAARKALAEAMKDLIDPVSKIEEAIKEKKEEDPDADVSVEVEALKKAKEELTGNDGSDLSVNNFVGPGLEGRKEGLYALENVDLFNLLCIPPYTGVDASGKPTDIDKSLIAKANAYCEKRRALLLVDPPSKWTDKDKAKTGITAGVGAVSKNAAVFFPRLKQPNPLRDNQVEEFVPCGAVAGVMARTDTQRGVWKAPAGIEATLRGAPELSVKLTDQENGELNPLGVNCLRSFPIIGRIVWGARTLRGADILADEYKYIPVRRLALFIEESLFRGTQWVVFEPNDEPLWAQIRLNVGAFMHNLFRQGAFQGATPGQAYFVKCDQETTPQNDIDRGIVNIVVGFAPLKPAEFVIIKLQQIAGELEV
jgi:Bacteriophage tail sheath protein